MKILLKPFLFLIALLTAGAGNAQAATITMDGTGCTLADAITAANTDTDEGGCVGSGIYGDDTILLETDVTLAAALPQIASPITIEGQGRTIDGNDSMKVGSVLRISADGDLTLNETTITDGNARERGGGIYNEGTVTLTDSIINGNSAAHVCAVGDCSACSYGGGMYNSGTATLTSSTVSGNSVTSERGTIAVSA